MEESKTSDIEGLVINSELEHKSVNEWEGTDVIRFLEDNQEEYDYDQDYIDVFKRNHVTGEGLLLCGGASLQKDPFNIEFGAACAIASLIDDLKTVRRLHGKYEMKYWHIHGTVMRETRTLYYYADQRERNKSLVEAIRDRSFVRLCGPRASGKSSRVWDAITELELEGYECIYVPFKSLIFRDAQSFWRSFNIYAREIYELPNDIVGPDTFLAAFFLENARWTKPVVLFIDEFDELNEDSAADACSSVLRAFRSIKNHHSIYAVHSIVAIGTFAILELNQSVDIISPFNVLENFESVSLDEEQVRNLYKEFASDCVITIESEVIDDIFALTNGHAGLVCLCGRAINNIVLRGIRDSSNTLQLAAWRQLASTTLPGEIWRHPTFDRMVSTLGKSQHRNAVDFLRSNFLGVSEVAKPVIREEDRRIAAFLAAQGVLLPAKSDGHNYISRFKMSSPLIDAVIRQRVIPVVYPDCPEIPLPTRRIHMQPMDTLEVLKEALRYFDKTVMKLAPIRSYKFSTRMVEGIEKAKIPRVSVYDGELNRILVNWLGIYQYTVTAQWHLRNEEEKNRYSDIIIKKDGQPTVVLELLATGSFSSNLQHIDTTTEYKQLISADEVWVVHFTCEDEYLVSDNLIRPTVEQVLNNIFIVHFWHNLDFTSVRMSALWVDNDGKEQQIDNQLVFSDA